MADIDHYTSDQLTIDVSENDTQILVKWRGKSIMRTPGKFITPILVSVLGRASDSQKAITMDFCDLEYMNSSSITPIIKILERARRGAGSITIIYDNKLRWQSLSFTALEIFETPDKRVEIRGSE